MKPYFAKYLPVEGEIKKGDWIIYSNLINSIPIQFLEGELAGFEKKIKLFLCGRDIQLGDKLTDKYGKNEYVYEGFDERGNYFVTNTTFPYGNCSKEYFEDCFIKVIGETSPEAIWVKEGDEFDEEEINIIYTKLFECKCEKPGVYRTPEQATCSHMMDDYRGGDWCSRQIDIIEHIKIKCPTCKKFH